MGQIKNRAGQVFADFDEWKQCTIQVCFFALSVVFLVFHRLIHLGIGLTERMPMP